MRGVRAIAQRRRRLAAAAAACSPDSRGTTNYMTNRRGDARSDCTTLGTRRAGHITHTTRTTCRYLISSYQRCALLFGVYSESLTALDWRRARMTNDSGKRMRLGTTSAVVGGCRAFSGCGRHAFPARPDATRANAVIHTQITHSFKFKTIT